MACVCVCVLKNTGSHCYVHICLSKEIKVMKLMNIMMIAYWTLCWYWGRILSGNHLTWILKTSVDGVNFYLEFKCLRIIISRFFVSGMDEWNVRSVFLTAVDSDVVCIHGPSLICSIIKRTVTHVHTRRERQKNGEDDNWNLCAHMHVIKWCRI